MTGLPRALAIKSRGCQQIQTEAAAGFWRAEGMLGGTAPAREPQTRAAIGLGNMASYLGAVVGYRCPFYFEKVRILSRRGFFLPHRLAAACCATMACWPCCARGKPISSRLLGHRMGAAGRSRCRHGVGTKTPQACDVVLISGGTPCWFWRAMLTGQSVRRAGLDRISFTVRAPRCQRFRDSHHQRALAIQGCQLPFH